MGYGRFIWHVVLDANYSHCRSSLFYKLIALVAQLVEVSVLETEGCPFESDQGHQTRYSRCCWETQIDKTRTPFESEL
jgi:hypothetical protein